MSGERLSLERGYLRALPADAAEFSIVVLEEEV
jgi:hypothetical protein